MIYCLDNDVGGGRIVLDCEGTLGTLHPRQYSIWWLIYTNGPSRAMTAQLQVNPPSEHAGAASMAPQAEVQAAGAGVPVTTGDGVEEVREAS